MNLKKYFSFKGRINRGKFFGITTPISIIVYIINKITTGTDSMFLLLFLLLLNVAHIALSTCLIVQRLHDIERPGTHYWLFLIPFYNFYLLLVLLLKQGTDGSNKYGEDPLQPPQVATTIE